MNGLSASPACKPSAEQAMPFGRNIEPGVLPREAQLDFFANRNWGSFKKAA